ncbi:MAG: hypothetical protein ACXVCI_00175 [Bdellovibrionota bacterium]
MKTATQSYTSLIPVFLGVAVLLAVAKFASLYMSLATFAYLLLCGGIAARKQSRALHGKLMGTAVLIDFSLVAVLEFQRSAVATAVSLHLNGWQQAHVYSSSMAALLSVPLLAMGLRAYRRPASDSLRRRHRHLGWLAFFFRTVGFVLMFSMAERWK